MINNIVSKKTKGQKQFAVLLDPETYFNNQKLLKKVLENANKINVDFLLAGGSITSVNMFEFISLIKNLTSIPVLLFPGSLLQISDNADGILLLSLISGRNADFLIGNHVLAANKLKTSGLEIIPTGYILVEGGKVSTTEYISNTRPIPADKPEIAVATALAGEMLGLKLIYLEAGSGAQNSVNEILISHVSKHLQIPLIVGGGIKSESQIKNAYRAGADIVVVGNAIEQNPDLVISLCDLRSY